MGYALARDCMLRGANVTLVSGQSALTPPPFTTVISVTSAKEMFDAVTEHAESQDIIIKAAAVADYRPASIAAEKMKKKEDALTIEWSGLMIFKIPRGTQASTTVSMWIFHGDRAYA